MNLPSDDEVRRRLDRQGEIMDGLPPELPTIPRIVMSMDIEHGERLMAEFEKGNITAEQAVTYSGSYARVGNATTLWGQGLLSDDWFFDRWPSLWRGSDPDDTDPALWDIWQQAFKRAGKRILDGDDLPGKGSMVSIYRGQKAGDPVGCAWTTDIKVAQAFAEHGGLRTKIEGGRVMRSRIAKSMVLAYLTGRDEAEVIIDPRELGWSTP